MTYFTPGILPSALRVCCAAQNVPDVLVTWCHVKVGIAGVLQQKKPATCVAGFSFNTPAMTYFTPGILPFALRVCCAAQNVPDIVSHMATM